MIFLYTWCMQKGVLSLQSHLKNFCRVCIAPDSKKYQGGRKAWHITVTHLFDDHARLCLTLASGSRYSCGVTTLKKFLPSNCIPLHQIHIFHVNFDCTPPPPHPPPQKIKIKKVEFAMEKIHQYLFFQSNSEDRKLCF